MLPKVMAFLLLLGMIPATSMSQQLEPAAKDDLNPSLLSISAPAIRAGNITTDASAGNTPSVMAPGNAMMIAPLASTSTVSHPFWDRTNMIGFAVHGAIRIADTAQTCALLGQPGRHEAWLPVKSCAGIAAYSLAMVPAQIGSSYLLHRRGHHKMERMMPYLWAAPSAAGIAFSIGAW